MLPNIIKIAIPMAGAFFLAILLTPIATHFFYKYKMWKKYSRNIDTTSSDFHKIHNEIEEIEIPELASASASCKCYIFFHTC